MDKSINTTGDGVVEYVSEKIKNNKEAFMLGLTYMNRWYDINYGKMNTKIYLRTSLTLTEIMRLQRWILLSH